MKPAAAEVLRAVPAELAAPTRRLLEAADARRLAVYLVGGPVRDWLLGRPLRDVDLVVEPRGEVGAPQLAREAATPGLHAVVHERFGTASLSAAGAAVDLASARSETYAHDGALPRVAPGTLEDDLLRRDFTVNALALPLSAAARSRHADVVDPSGGLADLERRRLRVLHPKSFHDDPTRALRAARLAPRLGFAPTRGTLLALRAALRDGAFGHVSGERLRAELVKLFDDARQGLDPARALGLLDRWHVLGALEPGLSLERSAVTPLRRLAREIEEPSWPAPRWRPWLAGLALWLAPLEPGLRRAALRRLSVRGEPAAQVAGFPRQRDTWLRALASARGRGAVDAVLAGADEDRLHALFASAAAPARRRIARWAACDRGRRPPVDGRDLVRIGLHGPAVGRALRRIRTAWLDGAVRTREEVLTLAAELSRARRAGG
jgi:tRNA nucleotidyltransferase (CCA-adding enzyme)